MAHTIIFDCEFLTAEGAQSRFWCGPHDPDPVIAQIGAVKIALEPGFPLIEDLRLQVIPLDRDGRRTPLDPVFTRLTGMTEAMLDQDGLPLAEALGQLEAFAAGARLWSWGKDEFNMIAISCYVQGLAPPIPVTRFGNACQLLLKAGMPLADLAKTRSNQLADYFGIEHPPLSAHDALDDARSVAFVIRHLLAQGQLSAKDMG